MTSGKRENLRQVLEKNNDRYLFALKASPDNLKLFLDCKPTPALAEQQLTVAEITNLILEVAKPEFLHAEIIEDCVAGLNVGKAVEQRRVAQGKASTPGRDGKLLFLVKKYERRKDVEFIDPRYIRSFDNVEPGTVVARIYQPTAGEEGVDVFGQPVAPKPGAEAQVEIDQTLSLVPPTPEEHYAKIVASSFGYLDVQGKSLTIKSELVIRGDIDYISGDVNFIGAVRISGSLMKGFSVSTGSDLEIGQDIVGGRVHYRGNVTVRGSITGDDSPEVLLSADSILRPAAQLGRMASRPAQITAAGTIRADLCDNASLAAGRDIEITRESRISTLRARGRVLVTQGPLIGGDTYAVEGVEAAIIGSPSAVKTRIYLLSDTESTPHYRNLIFQIGLHDKAEEILRLYLGHYADNPQAIERLLPQKRARILSLFEKLQQIRKTKEELTAEKQQIALQRKYAEGLRVNYLQLLRSGTTIILGDREFIVQKDIEGEGSIEYTAEMEQFMLGELKRFANRS